MSFSQAVSGLNAASKNLAVIGNNIANSATVGFKSGSLVFADMFSGSDVGMGVKVAAVIQNFNDGTITSSSGELDMAISNNGLFRLTDGSGQVYYSRNGQFGRDKEGYVINAQGLYLTGYPATGNPPTIQQGANPVPLIIPDTMLGAEATSKASLQVNLNSTEDILSGPFDPDDADTFNYSTSLTSYDSQGNEHNIALFFVKSADNTWDVYYRDGSDPNITAATSAGALTFDNAGILTGGGNINITTQSINGSAVNTFQLDLTKSIQQNLGKDVAGTTKSKVVDGYMAGNLVGYQIDDAGIIIGTYSNGESRPLGQIVLADFPNLQGLSSQGDNVWIETAASGQSIIGLANSGTFGSLIGNAVESSNVDLSQELVDMIVAQRNYQANSQTIKTQDQILNTLVNLR